MNKKKMKHMITNKDINKIYKKISLILVVIIGIIMAMTKLPNICDWVKTYQWKYCLLPFFLIGFIWLYLFFIPKIHPQVIIKKKDYVYFDAMIHAMTLIGIQYLVGILLYDIGKSPYDISLKGIWLNILTVILPFVAIEIVRAYVLNSYYKKENIAILIIVVVITVANDINLSKLASMNTIEELTIYLSKDIGPILGKQILLTCLALYGGSFASICYGGILLVFHWFIPVLPMLEWLAQGVIGLVIPVIQSMFVYAKYNSQDMDKKNINQNHKDTISWIGILGSSVALIWFVVGVFPIFPSVIVTGSMEPLIYPGDVIIIKQFYSEEEIKELEVGDIIYFQRDDIVITHRIVDIVYEKNGSYSFQTKGDNNSTEDIRLVLPQEVKGKYMMDIPKIGYPTYWLKSSTLRDRDDVEN